MEYYYYLHMYEDKLKDNHLNPYLAISYLL
jgi:hypothetical protein